MSAPFGKQPATFTDALNNRLTPEPSRVDAIAKQLGPVEGERFMDAMRDSSISSYKLRDALRAVGIRIAPSSITMWRKAHDIV